MTLINADWDPVAADHWNAPDGMGWKLTLDDPYDRSKVMEIFKQQLWDRAWKRASKHHLGAGLENGRCDTQLITRHVARLKRKGSHLEAGLLESIATCGIWTNQRASDNGYSGDTLCALCRAAPDTEKHRSYECPVVLQADNDDIRNTNCHCQRAIEACETASCFWLRGILPCSWLTHEPCPEERQVYAVADAAGASLPINLNGRTVFLDESGGGFSSIAWLRRAGWGIAVVRPDHALEYGFFAGVGGNTQTQIRGALSALKSLALHSVGDIVICPDCAYLVDGFNDIDSKASGFGTHVDIWSEIRIALRRRAGTVTMRKVSAHEEVDYVAANLDFSLADWIGNHFANALASRAAAMCAVAADTLLTYKAWQGIATNIQKRPIAVHKMHLEAQGPRRAQRGLRFVGPPRLQVLVERSQHQLQRVGGKTRNLACRRCHQKVKQTKLKRWLALRPCKPCVRMHKPEFEKVQAGMEPRVGNQHLHRSHSLLYTKGIWFCSCCAFYVTAEGTASGKSSAKGLAKPCSRVVTKAGKQYLSRIQRGLPPRANMDWPTRDARGAVLNGQGISIRKTIARHFCAARP